MAGGIVFHIHTITSMEEEKGKITSHSTSKAGIAGRKLGAGWTLYGADTIHRYLV
jgi:hypothetical protein